jgi:hypothetical protein
MNKLTSTSESPPSLSDVASLSEGSDAETLSLSSGTSSEEGGVRLDASEHGWDPLPSSHDSEASSSSHASEVPRHTHSSVPQSSPEPPAQSTLEQFTTPEIARPVEELARSLARQHGSEKSVLLHHPANDKSVKQQPRLIRQNATTPAPVSPSVKTISIPREG